MSIDRWMDKEDVCVYTHREWNTTQTFKKLAMPFVAAWMDLEINMLSEVRQEEKDIYHVISSICGISKEYINETGTESQT